MGCLAGRRGTDVRAYGAWLAGEVAMKLHIRYDVNGAPVGVRCYCAKCTMHGIWNRRYAILYGAFLLAGALVAAQIAVRVVMFVVSRVR
jgi:hypothetical protein